jgi:hypothetical protein
MEQLTIFDFVDNEVDQEVLACIEQLFPGWTALGYAFEFDWGDCRDYSAMICRDNQYKWVHVAIYRDGKCRVRYSGERTDFEPYWFRNKKRVWVWKSIEAKERVLEVARKNQLAEM